MSSGIFIIADQESLLRNMQLEKICKKLKQDKAEILRYTCDGQNSDQLFSEYCTRPMFNPHKIIIVNDAQKIPVAIQEEIVACETPNYLILLADIKLADAPKKFKPLTKFIQSGQKKIYDNQLGRWAQQQFREKYKAMLALDAASLLIKNTGHQLEIISQELDNLYLYKGGDVNLEDVTQLVSRKAESNIFDLVDAVATGDRARALSGVWRELGESGAVGIVSLLGIHFKRLRDWHGKNGRSFYEKKLSDQASRFSRLALDDAVLALVEADVASKRSAGNESAMLEILIFKLCNKSSNNRNHQEERSYG